MSIISEYITQAEKDCPVWISDVRKAFDEAASSSPLVLRLIDLKEKNRDYSCPIPEFDSESERNFLLDYLSARMFNLISVYSSRGIEAYCRKEDGWLKALLKDCFSRFDTENGYKKVINIAKRLSGSSPGFAILPLENYISQPAGTKEVRTDTKDKIKKSVAAVKKGSYCGIDVGGTDIKLAACVNGKLAAVKEYDWNPSLSRDAQSIKEPIIMLTKLMAACAINAEQGSPLDISAALEKDASKELMERAVAEIEKYFGVLPKFTGIGLSFPDIVIDDRIMGGESPKTIGIRNDPTADYESELLSLSRLTEELKEYSYTVHAVNDGPMAAFSSFCELGFADMPQAGKAMLAHSLGTDLGTGWIDEKGSIPPFPLECYDLLFDMGSTKSKLLPAEDLRSLRNENSDMAGARRYLGQAAVYRLVYKEAPEFIRDFTTSDRTVPSVRLNPVDMRKSCLAHIMQLVTQGDAVCCRAFRQIGVNLGQISREIEYITHAEIDTRYIFGRFVKNKRCFELISEGFESVMPEVRLIAADEDMACTPLMRELAHKPGTTVAQFAQAVSGIYYSVYAD